MSAEEVDRVATVIRDRIAEHGYAMSMDTARDLAQAVADEVFTFTEVRIMMTAFAMYLGVPQSRVAAMVDEFVEWSEDS